MVALGWATGDNLTAVTHVTRTAHGEPPCWGSFLSVRGMPVKTLFSENTQIKFFLLFLAVMIHGLMIVGTVVDADI